MNFLYLFAVNGEDSAPSRMPVLMESRKEKVTEAVSDRNSKREELNGLTRLESFKVATITNSNGNYSFVMFLDMTYSL